MNFGLIAVLVLFPVAICGTQTGTLTTRIESESYVAIYAKHYRVLVAPARAIVERESNWRACAVSRKGAVGLMQLMPITTQRLGITDRCNPDQNIAGGVRYLAWLTCRFHGDLRPGGGRILRRRKQDRLKRTELSKSRCHVRLKN